ncbi:hypothetical protein [Flavobacterium sp. GCM10023249]|uniref:hypothetical protein n=1 Tax=unclassified Flavobacterium TaxID=196869 RepID=UPI0036077B41
MKNSLYTLIVLLLVSCGKDNNSKTTTTTTTLPTSISSKPDTKENHISATESALQEIIFKTDSVKKHLTTSNALALYLKFRENTTDLITKINNDNGYIIDNYYTHISEKSHALELPDSLQTKFKNLEKAHIEFWEIGEGYIEIRPKADFYQTIFDNKLPPDYNEFVKLEAFENKDLIGADAGLVITFQELSVLVLNWEKFLLKYPNSKLYAEVKENYKNLLSIYLFGLDNTPTFEDYGNEDNQLNAENKKEFERFISKNPKSITSKIVISLLEGIQNNLKRDELHKKIEQDYLKYPITTNE